MYFSTLSFFKGMSWKEKWLMLPFWMLVVAFIFFAFAFMDLNLSGMANKQEIKRPLRVSFPKEGIAIYLLLDQSGSMNEVVHSQGPDGYTLDLPKIDFLKLWSEHFILSRPSDLIGIIAFARIPQVLVPLTLDQNQLLKAIDALHGVKNIENEGTEIGYAIFKSIHLIAATRYLSRDLPPGVKPPYEIKSAAIVVVTDGFQDPSRLDYGNRLRTIDLEEAAEDAKKEGIHLYIINIDPSMASNETYAPHRRQMKKITQVTGGDFFSIEKGSGLKNIFEKVNHLEKGGINLEEIEKLQHKNKQRLLSFFPYLIALGMLSLMLFILMETMIFRPIP